MSGPSSGCSLSGVRDLRRTASKERADGGASAHELASGSGHSIAKGSEILDVYNPPSFTAAKSAQDKREAGKQERKEAEKFENTGLKCLKADDGAA